MDSNFPENEVIITVTIGIVIMLLISMAFILFFYFSQKKFRTQQLMTQAQEIKHQKQLLFSSIQTQENERERIARELHDEVGSKLNIINLGIHRLVKSKNEGSLNNETISELFDIMEKTIEATRNISHDLLPPTLERFGIQVALEELCEDYQKNSEVKIYFELCQDDRTLKDNKIELNIFRVIQELISNTFKHANANRIELKLWLAPQHIRLTYLDNGIGFDQNDKMFQMGMGLQNIESRMRMIGVEYSMESSKGNGMFFQIKKLHS